MRLPLRDIGSAKTPKHKYYFITSFCFNRPPAQLTAGSHVLSLLLILSLCFRTSELLDIYLTKYKNILHNLVVSVGNISPGLIRYIYHLWLAAALTLAAFQFGLIIVMYRGSQAMDCIDRSIQTFCDAGRYC